MPTPSDPLAISIQNVSKTFRIFSRREAPTRATEVIVTRIRHPFRRAPREDFQALTDVSIEITKAERVGLIGRNGAGKSTLLKILSRITVPTSGRIEIYGRLGSLLEVGTGFNPELTGRENVFLNGAILGMKRAEILREFDAIVDFAEIGTFLDTPVKRYSSGMYVRLAFAVAAHLNPEILLVDEVLAVGDARFQQKCLGKMGEVSSEYGRTIVFVSHNMPMVQSLCPRTVYLDAGRVAFDGATAESVEEYLAGGSAGVEGETGVFDLSEVSRPDVKNPVLRRVELRNPEGRVKDSFAMGEDLCITIDLAELRVPRQFVDVRIVTDTGIPVGSVSTRHRDLDLYEPDARPDRVVVRIPGLPLVPGRYTLNIAVMEEGGGGAKSVQVDRVVHAATLEVVAADVYGTGRLIGGRNFSGGVVFLDSYWEIQRNGLITGATPTGERSAQAGLAP
ncbi:MAG: ABC transporter ATP-binding protein [Actinomycetota bacterium]